MVYFNNGDLYIAEKKHGGLRELPKNRPFLPS